MKNFLLLVLLVLAVSCNKEKDFNSLNPTTTANFTKISGAKQWFESKYLNSIAGQLNAQKTKNKKKSIDWEKAIIDNKQNEERVYIPISYSERTFLAQEERFRLLITTDKNGGKEALILHYIADNKYYNVHKSLSTKDFTGIILVYDWEDNFLYGVRYKEAKIVGDVSASSSTVGKGTSGSAKLTQDGCMTITTVYYSQSCSNGQCSDAVEVYRSTFTFCSSDGPSTDGSPLGGKGGPLGGGGGDGSGSGGGNGTGCGDALVCPDGTPNASLQMFDGRLIPLRIETCQEGEICGNHIEVTLKVEDGKVTNVTSHMSGITGGATYVQTDWVQNSAFNGIYTFSFAFHANFAIPLIGIGDLGANNTAVAHCTYDSNAGSLATFFEKP